MKKMNIGKVFAAAVSAAVLATSVLGSVVPSSAADPGPLAGLRNYNTPYTSFTTVGNETGIELSVAGQDASYQPVAMTETEAKSVTWTLEEGSLKGVTMGTATVSDQDDDGWISTLPVSVEDTETYGYAVLEAALPNGGSFDLTIAVNPTEGMTVAPVENITVNIEVDGKDMATYTGLKVGKTPTTGQYQYVGEEYPNALSAVVSLPENEDKTTSDNVVTAVGLFPDDTGYTEYLTTLTMKNGDVETTYPNIAGQYWTYTVTHVVGQDAEGKDIVETYPMSEIVGLGTFQLHTGDTINLICDYYNAE